jgi:hypothetical protein
MIQMYTNNFKLQEKIKNIFNFMQNNPNILYNFANINIITIMNVSVKLISLPIARLYDATAYPKKGLYKVTWLQVESSETKGSLMFVNPKADNKTKERVRFIAYLEDCDDLLVMPKTKSMLSKLSMGKLS